MKKLSSIALVIFSLASPTWAETVAPAATGSQYLFKLTYDDAEQEISKALVAKGAGDHVAATIMGRKDDALFSYKHPITVEIRGLKFDKSSSHWDASLLAVADGEVITAAPVAGRYEETVSTPVLKRQVRKDEVIKETDIEVRDFPASRTHSNTILAKDELIGKSPLRTISAGRAVHDNEIERPAIIKKNQIVQMRYSLMNMEITTTGQAMDEGAKGNVIAVRNLNSKKIVRAVVENDSSVSVTVGGVVTGSLEGAETYAKN